MASSLQQGINAAKAGRMKEALDHLKDAIIEEPQNADVWVWVAAIIDDIKKQEIFLEKALEIDPNNIPAQRGLAYLQKRKRDAASVSGEHLSDYTTPITPFPASQRPNPAEMDSGWTRLSVDELEKSATAQPRRKNDRRSAHQADDNTKLSTVEITLLGVVVLVFAFIGFLASSAIFHFDLPFSDVFNSRTSISSEPPYPGVFLYENRIFFDIQRHEGLPTQDTGMPTTYNPSPTIIFWQTGTDLEQLKLIYQTGEYINFTVDSGRGDTNLLQPAESLQSGLYCFQQRPDDASTGMPLFWCFKVADISTGE